MLENCSGERATIFKVDCGGGVRSKIWIAPDKGKRLREGFGSTF